MVGDPSRSEKNELQDLAVVIFPDNTARAYSEIFPGKPANRTKQGTLVGYGDIGLDSSGAAQHRIGTKRVGFNNQVLTEGNFPKGVTGVLAIGGNPFEGGANKPELGSITSSGDSGGPLFIDGKIAGGV